MKYRFLIFLLLITVLVGCGNQSLLASGNITSFDSPAFDGGELALEVGDSSDGWVSPNIVSLDDFSEGDVTFVSEDESVAVIEYTGTRAEIFLYYTVTAVGEGETFVYVTDENGSVCSTKQSIRVGSKDAAIIDGEGEANILENPENTQAVEKNGVTYVLNTSSKKIHLPSCSSVGKIKSENYAETDDYTSALSEGYVPCKSCNP